MTELQSLPPAYDSQFWRIRARLLKRANGRPLSEVAMHEARLSLERATQWSNTDQEASAAGERRRAERLRLLAQFETETPPRRASLLRLRAKELLRHGQTETAATLASEADAILGGYLEKLSTEALQIQNASNVLQFALASLAEDPAGPHAKRLRKLAASARRTIAGAVNAAQSLPAA